MKWKYFSKHISLKVKNIDIRWIIKYTQRISLYKIYIHIHRKIKIMNIIYNLTKYINLLKLYYRQLSLSLYNRWALPKTYKVPQISNMTLMKIYLKILAKYIIKWEMPNNSKAKINYYIISSSFQEGVKLFNPYKVLNI